MTYNTPEARGARRVEALRARIPGGSPMTCRVCGLDYTPSKHESCPGCSFRNAAAAWRADMAAGRIPVRPRAKYRHDRGVLDREMV